MTWILVLHGEVKAKEGRDEDEEAQVKRRKVNVNMSHATAGVICLQFCARFRSK